MLFSQPVIVLGSKPNSVIPNLNFKKIYTANGAAELGSQIKIDNIETQLNCVVPMREFLKNSHVKEKVLNSNPNRVIFRTYERDIKNLFKKNCIIENLSWKEQFDIQCKYINYSPYRLYLGELQRNTNITGKIKHMINCIIKKQFFVISTGFFAIMLAHKENPSSDIIVSGIGMSGGKNFYNSERNKIFDYTPRARVDRYIAKFIKQSLRSKIYSVDDDFVEYTQTKKLVI